MARPSTTTPLAADSLATYRAKRDFAKTAEPSGATNPASGNGFLVQKHDATRLHYDFRLELDGVLLSWAVTRGRAPTPTTSGSPSGPKTIRSPMRRSRARSPRANMAGAR